MKIEALNLVNFRSHKNTSFAFDRLNFIVGENRAGKSTAVIALEWLLTGRCETTDEGGKGADDLILKGESTAEVCADISVGSDSFEMLRDRTAGGSKLELHRDKLTAIGKQAQEWLQKRLPTLPILSVALNSSRFLDLPATSQKNFLSSILADDGIPVPPELRWDDTVERCTIAELDRVYKTAFERRTEVNRKLKEFEHVAAPENLPESMPTVEQVRTKLSGIRADRDKAITQKAQRTSAHDRLTDRRRETAREIAELESQILPMAEEKRLKNLADKCEGAEGDAQVAATVRSQIELLQKKVAQVKALGIVGCCPTCQRSLTGKAIEGVIASFEKEIADANEALKMAQRGSEAYAKAAQYREKIKDSIAAVAEKERLERELTTLPEIATVDLSDLEQTISECDGRIAKGEEILLKVNEQRQKINEYNEKTAQRARLQDELSRLEVMLAFAGPDGARKKATGDKLQGFNASLNTILPTFGYTALISMEPFRIQVHQEGAEHKALEVHQLSESERFRFAVAFQIALAQVTGVDLVVIDRADLLDKESRRQLTGMLMHSSIGQAIVCSTSNEAIPENVPEGVKFFQLKQENGITRIAAMSAKVMVAA